MRFSTVYNWAIGHDRISGMAGDLNRAGHLAVLDQGTVRPARYGDFFTAQDVLQLDSQPALSDTLPVIADMDDQLRAFLADALAQPSHKGPSQDLTANGTALTVALIANGAGYLNMLQMHYPSLSFHDRFGMATQVGAAPSAAVEAPSIGQNLGTGLSVVSFVLAIGLMMGVKSKTRTRRRQSNTLKQGNRHALQTLSPAPVAE